MKQNSRNRIFDFHAHSIRPLSVMALVLASLHGCGGNETPDETNSAVSIEAAAPATLRDACEIITGDDVAAIEGGPIEARPEEPEGPDESSCAYGPPGQYALMYLTIYWKNGKDGWETWGAARGLGARLMQDPDVNVDSIVAGDPLAGIGDAAHYGDLLPSLVLVGDVLLEFKMQMLNDSRANFPVLARKAVSRL